MLAVPFGAQQHTAFMHAQTTPAADVTNGARIDIHRAAASRAETTRRYTADIYTTPEAPGHWFLELDGVDIVDREDDVLILASTVVIDMACHPDQRD